MGKGRYSVYEKSGVGYIRSEESLRTVEIFPVPEVGDAIIVKERCAGSSGGSEAQNYKPYHPPRVSHSPVYIVEGFRGDPADMLNPRNFIDCSYLLGKKGSEVTCRTSFSASEFALGIKRFEKTDGGSV